MRTAESCMGPAGTGVHMFEDTVARGSRHCRAEAGAQAAREATKRGRKTHRTEDANKGLKGIRRAPRTRWISSMKSTISPFASVTSFTTACGTPKGRHLLTVRRFHRALADYGRGYLCRPNWRGLLELRSAEQVPDCARRLHLQRLDEEVNAMEPSACAMVSQSRTAPTLRRLRDCKGRGSSDEETHDVLHSFVDLLLRPTADLNESATPPHANGMVAVAWLPVFCVAPCCDQHAGSAKLGHSSSLPRRAWRRRRLIPLLSTCIGLWQLPHSFLGDALRSLLCDPLSFTAGSYLEALLKLATVLGARHQHAHVEHQQSRPLQVLRDIAAYLQITPDVFTSQIEDVCVWQQVQRYWN